MAHLSGLIYKNTFCIGEHSTNNTLNGIKALWTVPSTARSAFIPLYAVNRYISGTPEAALTITVGTLANSYNNICTMSPATSTSIVKFDKADIIALAPGTTISYKYTGSTNGNPTHFYEIYLVGTFLTAS